MWHCLLCRPLADDHPNLSDMQFAEPNKRTLQGYLQARRKDKQPAMLQYSDLHRLPCILILCEKGRMGDTFPPTFRCLDLRIRTSENHTTFVQVTSVMYAAHVVL